MPILDDQVSAYLEALQPGRSGVMAEMEAVAERDRVPIVNWETGRLLATLCRVLDPVVLEVGTAIGYSTLHIAEQLERGRVVTLEIRHAQPPPGPRSRSSARERRDLTVPRAIPSAAAASSSDSSRK